MSVSAKICGISTLSAAQTAIAEGTAFLGFIHFAKSPRHLDLTAMSELMLSLRASGATQKLVSVVVDPDDAMIEALRDHVKPDLIQLHGKETPDRVAQVRQAMGIPVVKALSLSEAADLTAAQAFDNVADYLLFDAKPPKDASLPGGLGLSFDWTLLTGYAGEKPWFLAGGLTPDNVAEAVTISGAKYVDVSSGVESAPGVKDPNLISGFLRTVKAL
ncbi:MULTISPECIES: phosphoribosylanthranilate isomerase [Asticcacaulis]|uniref:phosphoribosylanthranilate isomerase n=1 Tax=Asticcacaulis TaxID=76890 RepID=UPI001AE9AC29|nr:MULTISPECIES: phosphoribosylanthranilate isomerase [Asticcacaulis]MBP2159843.1 phosphoribosylanthranilate isomerase [Asticcacaulis solisilvae]MDR6800888.1 phosphoribosylanthranilate isomerase [Asticcacaulis sp. BE141]